jgi:hypothetical protein
MAVVVLGVKQSMVQIGYCDMEIGGAQTERYKIPSSLIFLKGRLEMVHHAKRRLWIQQQRVWRRDPEDQEQNNWK